MPGKGRPFPKGVSGNPGGRPKVLGDVQELARQKSPEAINTLSNIMHDQKAPPAARVAAANALLDRGYGKPTQPISQTLSKIDPSTMSDEELAAILAATHNVEFAERWGRRVRNDIAADENVLGITLSEDSKAAARWSLTSGGEYYGVGAGVGISGFRANLGVGDDLFGSREDAYSDTVREKRWNWYVDDFSARLKPGAKRILMNTRWHEEDVAGSDRAEGDQGQGDLNPGHS